jgi:hypothetical protein
VRESQKFSSTSFSKLVMVCLEISVSFKNTKFDVHLKFCTEMCYRSQYILLLCSVQNLLQVRGTLLSCTCWWFASIQSFYVSVILHLDLFLLKNCQYLEHLYISSYIKNGRSDAMIRYCNEVHMTQVLWVIYSTRDLFVFLLLCSGFTSSM